MEVLLIAKVIHNAETEALEKAKKIVNLCAQVFDRIESDDIYLIERIKEVIVYG